jgi:hypothetical protein
LTLVGIAASLTAWLRLLVSPEDSRSSRPSQDPTTVPHERERLVVAAAAVLRVAEKLGGSPTDARRRVFAQLHEDVVHSFAVLFVLDCAHGGVGVGEATLLEEAVED